MIVVSDRSPPPVRLSMLLPSPSRVSEPITRMLSGSLRRVDLLLVRPVLQLVVDVDHVEVVVEVPVEVDHAETGGHPSTMRLASTTLPTVCCAWPCPALAAATGAALGSSGVADVEPASAGSCSASSDMHHLGDSVGLSVGGVPSHPCEPSVYAQIVTCARAAVAAVRVKPRPHARVTGWPPSRPSSSADRAAAS